MWRALAGLVGALCCLGAVAYAAAAREATPPGAPSRAGGGSIPAPRITQHPDRLATSDTARFGFAAPRGAARFECRLDRRGWSACRAPVSLTGLAAGAHRFSVRAVGARGRRGSAARFRWRLLEPRDFSIRPQLSSLGQLYPGAPPVVLPVAIVNPNPVPIFVTSLQVAATADAAGCASTENLALGQASVSSAAPLRVPARGSASLPANGISPPSIQLRDLPVNQDACQNARFPLAFSGKARG